MAALPHYPEFNHETKNKAAKWTKYVNRLRNYFTAYNIEDDKRKKAMLLTFVGEEVNDIIDELPSEQTTPEKNETHFDKLILAVQNHFNPENNTEYNRFIFRKKKTTPNIEDFHRELKEAAAMCRFTDRNAEIKSQLITGCLSEKVRQKGLMNPNMLLGDLINYAKMTETLSKQMEQMRLEDANSTTKPTASVNAVANKVTHEQQWPRKRPQQNRCRNCNGKYPHERGPTSCPAFQNQCAYCQRWGHFASICFRKLNDEDRRRRTNRPPRPQAQTSQRPVNYIEDHQRDSNSGSDTEYVFHTGKVKNHPYFDLSFGDGHQMFNVLADSGATINILSEADYKSLRPTPLLRPTKTVISGFGVKEATPLLGQFSTLLKFRGISSQADIHVIKNPEKPIIGWETCKRLKLLSANTHSVNHISNSDAQTPLPTLKLLEDYADLFNSLGKLKEKKFTYT